MQIDFSETGNSYSGSFNTDLAYSVSGSNIPGFLVETTQTMTGMNSSLTAGELLVTGGNNTHLRITITGANFATVELDAGDGNYQYMGTIYLY